MGYGNRVALLLGASGTRSGAQCKRHEEQGSQARGGEVSHA